MKRKKKQKKKIQYTIFAQRIEDEIQNWLKVENQKYGSWNLFFREIKKRYENK